LVDLFADREDRNIHTPGPCKEGEKKRKKKTEERREAFPPNLGI
jgi:hypothetical protein